ncbi:cation diffusion facilitator family transporter [Streptomyces sp. SL13]|uniref:Cation diffusion facilitator family transporter n=1 Tax=Streptantibioticus silvisoli TaxID=2705255 RepID=A0AA90H5D3_9ACTN|nr:cation diffusion facilitator family transporter [Streptantibioticus silvisoli]MDI5974418.1 cation diffusion facilitator family transporter [Streptantibioticus silvisoli]
MGSGTRHGHRHDHGRATGEPAAARPGADHRDAPARQAEEPGDHGHDSGPGAAGHDHGTGGHTHAVAADADRRWLVIALALIVAFMGVEVFAGVVAHSLALVSDAAHMLTDAASIGLALLAMRLAARPARGGFTYGLKRAEILSAQANGITLLLLSVWLGYESVRRLIAPPQVTGGLVLATALVGVAVNLVAAWALSRANRTSLNVEGAFQHILTDLYGFVATAAAGLVVLLTGFARADAIASLVVVALMLRAGTGLVRESGRIFLEAAPSGIDPDALGDRLVARAGVVEVHDLHVWEITSGQPALSAHILVEPGGDCHAVQRGMVELLRLDYGIGHTTLQVDHAPQELLNVTGRPGNDDGPPPEHGHCADAHGPVHREGPHPH